MQVRTRHILIGLRDAILVQFRILGAFVLALIFIQNAKEIVTPAPSPEASREVHNLAVSWVAHDPQYVLRWEQTPPKFVIRIADNTVDYRKMLTTGSSAALYAIGAVHIVGAQLVGETDLLIALGRDTENSA